LSDIQKKTKKPLSPSTGYADMLSGIVGLLEDARRASARTVNVVMTAAYWEIGRRIVEYEQKGEKRARYGGEVIVLLAVDLTKRFGRGFGTVNLSQMRKFYQYWPPDRIFQTVSEKSICGSGGSRKIQTVSEKSQMASAIFTVEDIARCFPLPWSNYVRLLSVKSTEARAFYEAEALRGGWSVRQLDRQISTLFYERTALSRNKAAILKKEKNRDQRMS
jgi:DUF1016 N-terminal domain